MARFYKLTGDALAREIARQSRPRRFPWQAKTVRDLIDERRGELAETAASRSLELAQAALEYRDQLAALAGRQSRHRRFPWQAKTARDRLDEQSAQIMQLAAEQSSILAREAVARRDELLTELERQLHPRRFPWQTKTARDQMEAQNKRLRKVTNAKLHEARDLTSTKLYEARDLTSTKLHEARENLTTSVDDARRVADDALARTQGAISGAGEQAHALAAGVYERTQSRGMKFGIAALLAGLAVGLAVAATRGLRETEEYNNTPQRY